MKKLFASFGWLLILLPFVSIAGTNTIVSNFRLDEQKRNVSSFNGLAASGSIDVYIKIGGRESLRLEGDAEAINDIETVVEKGILKIRHKKGISKWLWNSRKVNVYITAKNLSSINLSGSGDIEVSDLLEEVRVDAVVSGSGSLKLTALARIFNASISGSGSITAAGKAETTNISISGSGEFQGKKFRSKTVTAGISGSGEATVFADKTLNAKISGSGDIFYDGNPTVNAQKSGSGKITKI